jgi:hypothetical protein
MQNRRKFSRYHLVCPLAGYIEHGEVRRRGEIVELSTAGFRLRLRNTAREVFISQISAHDFGEIHCKEQEIDGFGEIRYLRSRGSDLLVGFKWDDLHADESIDKSFAVISQVVSQGIAGCVNVSNGSVELIGHVSSVLAEDLQQSLHARLLSVSLAECTSIDTSGLAMLVRLEDAKVPLKNVSAEVAALMHQHRMLGAESIVPEAYLRSAA